MQTADVLIQRASWLGFDALTEKLRARVAPRDLDAPDDHGEEIRSDVAEALGTEDRQEREAAALDLLRRYPYSSALIEALLDRGWLDDRPLEAALFAWDALNHIFFPVDQPGIVARLASTARPAGDLLPGETSLFVPLRGDALADAIDRFFSASDESDGGTLARAKRSGLRGDELDAAELAELAEAAQQQGDAEATFVLEGVGGFADEESRFEAIVALLESARELVSRGFPTLASFKLAVVEAIEDDDEARRMMGELLLDQGRIDDAASLFDESELDEEIDDCVQFHVGFGARVAIERGDFERANQLLVPYFNGAQTMHEAVEMARTYPELAVAAAELIVRTQQPNPLARTIDVVCRQDELNRAAHRLRAIALLGQAVKGGATIGEALSTLVRLTDVFPGYRPLWSSIATIAQQGRVPGDDYMALIGRQLERQPQSSFVWYMLGLGLEGEAQAAFAEDYDRLLQAQVAQCRRSPHLVAIDGEAGDG
ncbi:MAG: hypothetical protein KC609_05645 [Myxococcales bacterium]|nr:hypothetical protein [Myxococcales bacterium]